MKDKKQYILLNGNVRAIQEGADVEATIQKLAAKGYQVEKIKKPPTISTLHKWNRDGIAKATDGCQVEPDGTCIHGKKSWLLIMHLI